MNAERPTSLLPPRPDEHTGRGHLARIWREYPTDPLELLLGGGNLIRGIYVAWPGYHDAMLHFPASVRLGLAVAMGIAGGLQVFACLYGWGKLRAACAIILVILLIYIGGVYIRLPYEPAGVADTVVLLYGVFAVGEAWIVMRTPALIPLSRWVFWWRERSGQ